ncbi:MAG: BtrH N-terminal domain-containing protein [Pseudomonadales bacterium]
MLDNFDHRQAAHCESGVISSLLRNAGLNISEPMVFGLSGAMTFAYIPLIKIGGMPLISYRMPPGRIVKGVTRRLGVAMAFERFRHPETGMQALRRHLDAGQPVGLQSSVYWLPYFPEDMRFHFNAHNMVAYAYEENNFLISDPTFESTVVAEAEALQKARFVRGTLAPKGLLYYPSRIPPTVDYTKAIAQAIQQNTNMMLRTPLPIVGVRGIRFMSRKIRRLASQHDKNEAHNKLYIGHMVRMQEEIGTGGGGFRFLYASFLQESATLLQMPELLKVSSSFTDVGDEWRRYALYAAKMIKGRMAMDYDKLADQLLLLAGQEEDAYRQLQAIAFK